MSDEYQDFYKKLVLDASRLGTSMDEVLSSRYFCFKMDWLMDDAFEGREDGQRVLWLAELHAGVCRRCAMKAVNTLRIIAERRVPWGVALERRVNQIHDNFIEFVKNHREAGSPALSVFEGNRTIYKVKLPLSRQHRCYALDINEPGRYSIRTSDGRILWEEQISQELISGRVGIEQYIRTTEESPTSLWRSGMIGTSGLETETLEIRFDGGYTPTLVITLCPEKRSDKADL